MRLVVLPLVATALTVASSAFAQKLETTDRFKISIGSASSSDTGSTNSSSVGTMVRLSYNIFETKRAQELRFGIDRTNGGSAIDAQYIWRFGKKQNGYYGTGLGIDVNGGGGLASGSLGLNIGKQFFVESRAFSDGTTTISTLYVGFRF